MFGINNIATAEANGKSGTVIVGAVCFFSLGECSYPYTAPYFPICMSGSTAIGKGHPILSYITPTHSFHNRDGNCPPQ